MPKGVIITVVIVFMILVIGVLVILATTSSDGEVPSDNATTTVEGDVSTETEPVQRRGLFEFFGWNLGGSNPPAREVETSSSGSSSNTGNGIRDEDIPHGYTRADLSQYFGKITVDDVRRPNLNSAPPFIYTIVIAGHTGETRVPVTNWKLQTNHGSVFIPKGDITLSPDTNVSGEAISLRDGEVLFLHTNTPPHAINFRLNKCTGYLNEEGFLPKLPQECPEVFKTRSELSLFSAECQDYVLSLGRCEGPLSRIPEFNDGHCFATLLTRAEYRGCFNAHRNDSDFARNEWHAWLGTNAREFSDIFDSRHDRVLLLDDRGKIVDEFFY
ncbi:MAG: hypothetical protein COU08_00380 [Candidatus Harrisonbacteria bacterium CG10_big_fil_rev_8_21_14_0_10_42_17]|uniref:LTD domain-containing protein n=1 Tax=Candidatus Harrisonbacteria bacterium CG10_big_fil_rev_8_21_14_0_10_42_17 TaxID=1974584 RepID=A0A2M6WJ74_9BACT|nr:MAG: hypothetical protein COU08_00380 [Candidatus Harrisonbacteria bacterium CG10_big_fil_rev_8_21_14_0_10_42_17]